MAGLIMDILERSDDEVWKTAHTEFLTNGAIVAGSIQRMSDSYLLANLYSWSSANDWKTVVTPADGESGEIWGLFTDTADSNKKRFQLWKWTKSGGTVTFTTSGTVAVVDIGEATTKLQLQNNGGAIQVLHSAGANRTCSCAIRIVRVTV